MNTQKPEPRKSDNNHSPLYTTLSIGSAMSPVPRNNLEVSTECRKFRYTRANTEMRRM